MVYSEYGLLTKPTLFDFFHEKLITLVPFFIALIALFRYSSSLTWPILYLVIIGVHMTHIFIKRCPHSEYYKAETNRLECLWWRWVPKIRKKKSGPPPKYIRPYTIVAVLVISLYPIYWMRFQWELLILYILSWGVLALSIYTAGCARCIDFECKNNAVPKEIKDAYLSAGQKSLE